MAVHQGRLFVAATQDDGYGWFGCDYEDEASMVYVSSDGVSFTPTGWWGCGAQALASTGDRLLALWSENSWQGHVSEWDSANEEWGDEVYHWFYPRSVAQHRFVVSGGAFYAAAFYWSVFTGGIYRTEDGTSWAPVFEKENMTLDVLTVEGGPLGDTLYAADDSKIYSLNLCE